MKDFCDKASQCLDKLPPHEQMKTKIERACLLFHYFQELMEGLKNEHSLSKAQQNVKRIIKNILVYFSDKFHENTQLVILSQDKWFGQLQSVQEKPFFFSIITRETNIENFVQFALEKPDIVNFFLEVKPKFHGEKSFCQLFIQDEKEFYKLWEFEQVKEVRMLGELLFFSYNEKNNDNVICVNRDSDYQFDFYKKYIIPVLRHTDDILECEIKDGKYPESVLKLKALLENLYRLTNGWQCLGGNNGQSMLSLLINLYQITGEDIKNTFQEENFHFVDVDEFPMEREKNFIYLRSFLDEDNILKIGCFVNDSYLKNIPLYLFEVVEKKESKFGKKIKYEENLLLQYLVEEKVIKCPISIWEKSPYMGNHIYVELKNYYLKLLNLAKSLKEIVKEDVAQARYLALSWVNLSCSQFHEKIIKNVLIHFRPRFSQNGEYIFILKNEKNFGKWEWDVSVDYSFSRLNSKVIETFNFFIKDKISLFFAKFICQGVAYQERKHFLNNLNGLQVCDFLSLHEAAYKYDYNQNEVGSNEISVNFSYLLNTNRETDRQHKADIQSFLWLSVGLFRDFTLCSENVEDNRLFAYQALRLLKKVTNKEIFSDEDNSFENCFSSFDKKNEDVEFLQHLDKKLQSYAWYVEKYDELITKKAKKIDELFDELKMAYLYESNKKNGSGFSYSYNELDFFNVNVRKKKCPIIDIQVRYSFLDRDEANVLYWKDRQKTTEVYRQCLLNMEAHEHTEIYKLQLCFSGKELLLNTKIGNKRQEKLIVHSNNMLSCCEFSDIQQIQFSRLMFNCFRALKCNKHYMINKVEGGFQVDSKGNSPNLQSLEKISIFIEHLEQQGLLQAIVSKQGDAVGKCVIVKVLFPLDESLYKEALSFKKNVREQKFSLN